MLILHKLHFFVYWNRSKVKPEFCEYWLAWTSTMATISEFYGKNYTKIFYFVIILKRMAFFCLISFFRNFYCNFDLNQRRSVPLTPSLIVLTLSEFTKKHTYIRLRGKLIIFFLCERYKLHNTKFISCINSHSTSCHLNQWYVTSTFKCNSFLLFVVIFHWVCLRQRFLDKKMWRYDLKLKH